MDEKILISFILLLFCLSLYFLRKNESFEISHTKRMRREESNKKVKKTIRQRLYERLNYDEIPMPVFIKLLIWKLIDIYKNFRKPDDLRIYGIYGYFGLWGQGKTIAMTKQLYDLRKKYKDKIYIFTNYGFKLEDKPFTDWHMLLSDYDKPCIFAWDEVQNEFNSRDFKSFPTALLTQLTQNRKGNGKRILYSAQRWVRVDKVFRELTYICYECKTRFGRVTGVRGYDWEEYEQLTSTANVNMKIKIKSKEHHIFVQTDYLRSLYNSFQMLHTAKSKVYMDRVDIENLTS